MVTTIAVINWTDCGNYCYQAKVLLPCWSQSIIAGLMTIPKQDCYWPNAPPLEEADLLLVQRKMKDTQKGKSRFDHGKKLFLHGLHHDLSAFAGSIGSLPTPSKNLKPTNPTNRTSLTFSLVRSNPPESWALTLDCMEAKTTKSTKVS